MRNRFDLFIRGHKDKPYISRRLISKKDEWFEQVYKIHSIRSECKLTDVSIETASQMFLGLIDTIMYIREKMND